MKNSEIISTVSNSATGSVSMAYFDLKGLEGYPNISEEYLYRSSDNFYDFLNLNNYDVKKVKILTALIFLNIAPLHHFPYCKMLFYLGKESLFDILKEQDDT